jgi:hypothetical protein
VVQANPKTIDKLFNAQARYVVPMFQRLYVWGEDPQWRTLWEDVVEKADNRLNGKLTNAHYLGALIIEGVRPGSANEVTRLLLIDGQQRMTTIQLLLCAFRDYAKAAGWVSLERKTTRYLENPDADVMDNPDEEIFKVWPTQLNRDVFASIIRAQSRDEIEKRFPLVRRKYQRKPDARNPLIEAYLYFAREIASWVAEASKDGQRAPEEAGFALLQAIQQDFCVVEIALSEGDDSQEIFYSLNSQGRPLSQSDLLRSLIFMRAEKEREDRDAIFADFWGAFETHFWSTEIKRGGRTYSRLDIALRHFLTVKTGYLIDARRVNEEYKRWISGDPAPYTSVRQELTDFSRFSEVYKKYEGSFSHCQSTDFGRILQDLDVSTAMPLVMFLQLEAGLEEDQLIPCLSLLESFIVRRAFNGDENKEYNKLFVEVVAALRPFSGVDVQPALENKLAAGGGTTRAWPTDDQIIERAMSAPIYNHLRQPAVRLILERLERSLRGKKSENQDVQTGLQIEHVMPVSWYEHWPVNGTKVSWYEASYPWTMPEGTQALQEAIRVRATFVHTLGNLTLLNEYANPAASNGSLDLKLKEYAHSTLRLNRYFDQISDWNEAAIRERGRMLGKVLCSIWPRPAPLPSIID